MQKRNIVLSSVLLRDLKGALLQNVDDFLTAWCAQPEEIFYEPAYRTQLVKLHKLANRRFPTLLQYNDYTEPYLSDMRLNMLLQDITSGDLDSFRALLEDLQRLADCSFSDRFCSRLIGLLMFLLQNEYYAAARQILVITPWIGLFEDALYTDRVCICTFAITVVPCDDNLLPLLQAAKGSFWGDAFLQRKSPLTAALETGRSHLLPVLLECNLCFREYEPNT